jgi:hypothetical protein
VIPSDSIMRWENEGGAVPLQPKRTSVGARASKAKRSQKRPISQARADRQSLMDARAGDRAPA